MSTLSLILIGMLVVTIAFAFRSYYDRAHWRDYIRAWGWCLLVGSVALVVISHFTPTLRR